MVKVINVQVDDTDYEIVQDARCKSKLTWKEYVVESAKALINQIQQS